MEPGFMIPVWGSGIVLILRQKSIVSSLHTCIQPIIQFTFIDDNGESPKPAIKITTRVLLKVAKEAAMNGGASYVANGEFSWSETVKGLDWFDIGYDSSIGYMQDCIESFPCFKFDPIYNSIKFLSSQNRAFNDITIKDGVKSAFNRTKNELKTIVDVLTNNNPETLNVFLGKILNNLIDQTTGLSGEDIQTLKDFHKLLIDYYKLVNQSNNNAL